MQHTRHSKGDNGAYFFFDDDAFTKMVGNADWDGKTFKIKKTGSEDWTGTVMVWKRPTGSHGRRNGGSDPGHWAADDKIILGSCGRYTE